MIHEIPLERRTLHGHFSPDLPPVVTIDPGDGIRFATLNAGWRGKRRDDLFEPREPQLDDGHALVGPVEVRGARAGQTLEVRIDEVRVGAWGITLVALGAQLEERLGVGEGDTAELLWALDADARTGRDQHGRSVGLRPFLGVLGMPPPEPGAHSTTPPRVWGGNLDCTELVEGATLFLPIPVDGALFSAGDGHARQGDGEVSQLAIECPLEQARLTLGIRDDLELRGPIVRTADAWIVLGLDEDLDEAAARATDGMLDLMGREHGLERRDALALASVVVDLRVTQLVNQVKGVHAVLRHDAIRFARI